VALLLRKQGIKQIRPLQGGLDAWRERGYPITSITVTSVTASAQLVKIKED
jgi:3-mercaptopyruvate sulfurtransferase SseA